MEEIDNGGQKEARKAKFLKKIFNGDQSTKTASFLRRKPTLKKKAKELEILCGVDVTVVCYDANGNVDFWPENWSEVHKRCSNYLQLNTKDKKEKNYLDLVESEKKKLIKKKEKKGKIDVDQLISNLSNWVDRESVALLESKVKSLKQRIEILKQSEKMIIEPAKFEAPQGISWIDPVNVNYSCLNLGETEGYFFNNNGVGFGENSSNAGLIDNNEFGWEFAGQEMGMLDNVKPENMIFMGQDMADHTYVWF